MRAQHAIALTLALAGCKESFQQIEDPSTPLMVYYTIPG